MLGPALAGEAHLPRNAAQWFALENCAAYGPNYTSVEGTRACVRIGGHIRVQFGPRMQDYHFSEGHFGAMPTSAALRSDAPGSADFAEQRHLRVETNEESYR